METISGFIKHFIYSDPESGYSVFELATDTEEITCVGALHTASEGEIVRLSGEYVTHNLYGRQFSFSQYEFCEAQDEIDILRYLSSGAIKGIGPSLARKIVDRFSVDTFRVIEEEAELLAQIKGISLRMAQQIAAEFAEKAQNRKAMLFLQKYGVSVNMANRIYKRYGDGIFDVIEKNPYRLAEDIEGIGFRTADEIAKLSGIDKNSEYRIRSGIVYTLSSAVSEGHIFLPAQILFDRSAQLLDTQEDDIESQCRNLTAERKLVMKSKGGEVRVYLSGYYHMELSCARMLLDLDQVLYHDTGKIEREIYGYEEEDAPLDEKQRQAVVSAISNGVCVITGGPGTGKTTIINVLIKYLMARGDDLVLAAPTGRAAKRMTEATGYAASTIQRLLGLAPSGSDNRFSYEYNEDNPLEADTIIIDEMSMVDLPLFRALLSALVPGTRLIMVGDTNQLPSVGPGAVLKDIIASGCFCVERLDKIFRQDEASDIVINAHKVNEGRMPALDNRSTDFFMLRRNDVNLVLKNIVLLVTEKLPGYVKAEPFDIQVLTPMRRGPLGVENLNPILQRYINPSSVERGEKNFGSVLFREGDKVMQIRNNYQLEWEVTGKYGIAVDKGLGVFNGDMGIIDRIDNVSETVEVIYEENHRVRYPFSNLDELELAYAVTIHKSQGSEYPAVVIPLLTGPRQLFSRNLLYTAITRAKKCVTIVGSEETVEQMVKNADERGRFTGLKDALEEMSAVVL